MGDETPCPFCAWIYRTLESSIEDGRYGEVTRWWVRCDGCCACGPVKDSEYDALTAWAVLSGLRAEIAADLRLWAEQGGDPWMAHVADEVAAGRRPDNNDGAEGRKGGT